MKAKNVFAVTGRYRGPDGDVRGGIVEMIVCAETDEAARAFLGATIPLLAISTVTGLAAIQALERKIKAVLSANDTSWPVYVDPAFAQLDTA